MGSFIGRGAELEIIDPICVSDTFVDGGMRIEAVGKECIRITLLARRRNADTGDLELQVVSRLVYPRSVIQSINRQCRDFLTAETEIEGPSLAMN